MISRGQHRNFISIKGVESFIFLEKTESTEDVSSNWGTAFFVSFKFLLIYLWVCFSYSITLGQSALWIMKMTHRNLFVTNEKFVSNFHSIRSAHCCRVCNYLFLHANKIAGLSFNLLFKKCIYSLLNIRGISNIK